VFEDEERDRTGDDRLQPATAAAVFRQMVDIGQRR